MSELPDHYPFADAPLATLLEWAHMPNPPYEVMRRAAPWLRDDASVERYFDGIVRGRLDFWRYGPLFDGRQQ